VQFFVQATLSTFWRVPLTYVSTVAGLIVYVAFVIEHILQIAFVTGKVSRSAKTDFFSMLLKPVSCMIGGPVPERRIEFPSLSDRARAQ